MLKKNFLQEQVQSNAERRAKTIFITDVDLNSDVQQLKIAADLSTNVSSSKHFHSSTNLNVNNSMNLN